MSERDDDRTIAGLMAKHPVAYGNVYLGFEVGDGWLPILDELGAVMERCDVRACQIKEKFGGLRVYTDEVHDEVDAAIEAAEKRALATCEVCGEPGRRCKPNGWWIRTLCGECEVKHDSRT